MGYALVHKISHTLNGIRDFINIGNKFYVVGSTTSNDTDLVGFIREYEYNYLEDTFIQNSEKSIILPNEDEAYLVETDGTYLAVATKRPSNSQDSKIYIIKIEDFSIVCIGEGINDHNGYDETIRYMFLNNGVLFFDMYSNYMSDNGLFMFKFDGSRLYDLKELLDTEYNSPIDEGRICLDINERRLIIGAVNSSWYSSDYFLAYNNDIIQSGNIDRILSTDAIGHQAKIHEVKIIDDNTFLAMLGGLNKLAVFTLNEDNTISINSDYTPTSESLYMRNITVAGNVVYTIHSNDSIVKHRFDPTTKTLSFDSSTSLPDVWYNRDYITRILIHKDKVFVPGQDTIHKIDYRVVAGFSQSHTNGTAPLTVDFSAI